MEGVEKFQQRRAQNEIYTKDIAIYIFIRAQAASAERVPFRGRADEVFLFTLGLW